MNTIFKFLFVMAVLMTLLVSATAAQVKDNQDRNKNKIAKISKQLHGTWVVDAEKTIEEAKKNKTRMFSEEIIDHYLAMEVAFNSDGSFELFKSNNGDLVPLKRKWEVKKTKVVNMNHVLVVAFDTSERSSTEIHIIGDNGIKLVSLFAPKYSLFMKRKVTKKLDDN